jgi:hypothetical protein
MESMFMFQLSVCLLGVLLAAAPQSACVNSARALVVRAIDAVGGEAALKGITSLQIEPIGHEYYIDQSERPEDRFVTT